jgi:hypothetical protein
METQQTLAFDTTSSVEKNASEQIFGQLINQTIFDVLSSLGIACRQAVYDYVEKRYNVKTSDIANHLMEFSEALERIFGDAAALLEVRIMKELHRKVPEFKHHSDGKLTFSDYLSALSSSRRG